MARPELRTIAGDRVIMNGWIVCGTWEVVLESGMVDDEFGGIHEAVPKSPGGDDIGESEIPEFRGMRDEGAVKEIMFRRSNGLAGATVMGGNFP